MTDHRIARVFPRRTSYTPTDDLAFVGDPPLLLPEVDEVHVSVTYTWDIEEGKRLAAAWSGYYPTHVGGPAFDSPAEDFTPGMYLKEGITFTTRGCNNRCRYCLVPRREGKLKELTNFAPGKILQDNNLLQASPEHLERVFQMLREQSGVEYRGGIDPRLVTEENAEGIRSTKPKRIYLAADTKGRLDKLKQAIELLKLPRYKISVYTIIGFEGEKIDDARRRLEAVWEAGGLPFAQLFQPPDQYIEYYHKWKELARDFSRPKLTMAIMKGR